ncbi:hypothetical protein [Lunatibacter salilacus]|uniref:hypothetical protein n=1 Tax=Lunatibacter salilacus TaxID=2483804 RepID=UPI00131E4167|nr:hypothetical protein [Lunatibacter salilacus]
MEKYSQIGVWLDYGHAIVIGYAKGNAEILETILSPVERIKREEGEGNDSTKFTSNTEHASNNEHKKHNIAQNEINEYLKTLEQKLQPYKELLLFGPGKAKEQLRNKLQQSKSFDGKWFAVHTCDKMTQNQLLAYVRDFYKKIEVG